jgi:hypothetical protein
MIHPNTSSRKNNNMATTVYGYNHYLYYSFLKKLYNNNYFNLQTI